MKKEQIFLFLIADGSHHLAQDTTYILPIMYLMLALLSPPVSAFGRSMLAVEVQVKSHVQIACCQFNTLQSETVTENLVQESNYLVWLT